MKHSQSQRAHAKLKTIGPELLHEVDEKLKFGKSSHEVTAYLHEQGALTDVKADSLRKMLDRYRQTELRDKTIAALTQAQRKDTGVTVAKRLHAIDELEELARVQHARLTKVLAQEQKAPLLIKSVGEEASRLQSMLSDLARLQLETGLIQRAPKKVFGTMTTPDGKPHEFVWTEEFDKLNEELQEFEHRVAHEAAQDTI
jgi:hypothetical protein